MTNTRWLTPEGGPIGWIANASEAIKSHADPSYYDRRPLTSADLRRLSKFDLSSTAFSQGRFDNCYLIATLKALMDSPWGRKMLRSNLEVTDTCAVVHFYCQGERIPVPVRSVFKRGRGWGGVIESAYATFRLEHKGRLPTMGFPGIALEELTNHKARISHVRKMATLQRALQDSMPALASTVRSDPTRFLDSVNLKKQVYNAIVPAMIPGVGRVKLQIRAAHVYQVLAATQNTLTLVNPWEYNHDSVGDIIRAKGVKHPGTFLVGANHFRVLFGQVATVERRA